MLPDHNEKPSDKYAREIQRLRLRNQELQRKCDQRNADLHRKVAYYESIRDRTQAMLNRFLTKIPLEDREGSGVVHKWDHSWVLPGSEVGFWVAFQTVLDADQERLREEANAQTLDNAERK